MNRYAVLAMLEEIAGSIISDLIQANVFDSCCKGGVSALVRTLALDYAPYGIRVNAVVPGATDTPMMWAGFPAAEREAARRDVEQKAKNEIPLGRLARPEEPARAVLWLLSDESSYVTGSHLVCDGGILAKGPNTF